MDIHVVWAEADEELNINRAVCSKLEIKIETGRYLMKAQVSWHDGLQFIASADTNHSIVLDSPKLDMGGKGSASTPFELILMGLAGCTAMDVISILQKKRQKITGFDVHVEGERGDEYPKVLTNIHIEYVIKGKNISGKAVERAIDLSETTYCGVSAMLKKTAEITNSYKIIEEDE